MGIFSRQRKRNDTSVEQAMDLAKTYDDLKPYYALFTHYFRYVLESNKKITNAIQVLQKETGQEVKEYQLLRELWGLRYAYSHIFLFNLKPPKNEQQLHDQVLTINSALNTVLKENNKLDYLTWLQDSLLEYIDGELNAHSLKGFRKSFPDKAAEKVAHIPFDATGGRLGGDLYDSIAQLVMHTIDEDKKVLSLED